MNALAKPSGYRRDDALVHPPYAYAAYKSTGLRAPDRPLLPLAHSLTEITGPVFGDRPVGPADHDLTVGHAGEPLGERIVVTGRVRDGDGRFLANQLVEVWQANAAGRYAHDADQHPAPLDAHFSGGGRCLTDADGRYEFVTIRPGAYPWGNHHNAWRPAHIHFSLFGPAFATRLVTQMYFPGDPLLAHDPIFASVPETARGALVARFDLEATRAGLGAGVLLGHRAAGPRRHPTGPRTLT